MEEVPFKLHLKRASGNATTIKATLMKVIAIGYRFKSRSSTLLKPLECKCKADPRPKVDPRATFHRTCCMQTTGIFGSQQRALLSCRAELSVGFVFGLAGITWLSAGVAPVVRLRARLIMPPR